MKVIEYDTAERNLMSRQLDFKGDEISEKTDSKVRTSLKRT